MDRLASWRLIVEDGVTDAYGLAADEALAGRVGCGLSPPTLRLYTYRSCALVGRFQTVEHEIHVEYCRAAGIPINRRPTGGGAIVMGPQQLGVALVLPGGPDEGYHQARERMGRFSAGLVAGLARLGIGAAFRGKNDIEVGGRKIAGLGLFRHATGGLLFHASLLVDLDVGHMLRVLRTPFEKISDKEIATVAERTSTVRRALGEEVELETVRGHVAEGYRHAFRVDLRPGAFTAEEGMAIAELERERYRRADWVFQRIEVPDGFGSARRKTPGGLLDIRVTLAGATVKALFLGGDFFAAEGAVADLEAALRWHPAAPEAIDRTLRAVYARRRGELEAIPLDDLVETVQAAVRSASPATAEEATGRYGCFVNPRAG